MKKNVNKVLEEYQELYEKHSTILDRYELNIKQASELFHKEKDLFLLTLAFYKIGFIQGMSYQKALNRK